MRSQPGEIEFLGAISSVAHLVCAQMASGWVSSLAQSSHLPHGLHNGTWATGCTTRRHPVIGSDDTELDWPSRGPVISVNALRIARCWRIGIRSIYQNTSKFRYVKSGIKNPLLQHRGSDGFGVSRATISIPILGHTTKDARGRYVQTFFSVTPCHAPFGVYTRDVKTRTHPLWRMP